MRSAQCAVRGAECAVRGARGAVRGILAPMGTRVLTTVEEYLQTQFEGSDCDYVDGEVVARHMGELPHAILQARLAYLLMHLAQPLHLQVLTEIRVQVLPTRFRVADLAVWRPGDIGTRIPTVAPFLVVEILSPEDRVVRLQPKIREYLTCGVEFVWVVDPDERRALCYTPSDPGGALVDDLRTSNPDLHIPLAELFAALK